MRRRIGYSIFAIALALAAGPAAASCGSAFCSVNTAWDTQGLSNDGGWLIDARYSYAKADRLRAGASRIAPAAPTGSDAEIEDQRTISQLLTFTADYTINSRWNVAVGLPLVIRDHSHTFDSSISGPFTQQAKFTELGDMRLVGKYKFDLGSMNSGGGIRFGLKLPTGATNKTMSPPDPADPTTPYKLERSSQPGTGSTDLILGAYYYRNLPGADWGWFASAQVQSAASTYDGYRPGTETGLDLGIHYAVAPALNLLLQLNGQYRQRDTGINANVASGGYSWYLSPGLSYALSTKTQIYGLTQFALRQYANTDPADPASGQLTAPWAVTAGISYRF